MSQSAKSGPLHAALVWLGFAGQGDRQGSRKFSQKIRQLEYQTNLLAGVSWFIEGVVSGCLKDASNFGAVVLELLDFVDNVFVDPGALD